jgi:hypothetical protein
MQPMRKIIYVLLAMVFVGLVGCLAKTQFLTISTKFDKETAEKQMRPGKNTLKGSALFRQAGGGIVTCAGNTVSLFPYSNYARERMTGLYLNEKGGVNYVLPQSDPAAPERSYTSSDPAYDALVENTQCNTQGFFTFNNLADGDYYVVTHILWRVDRYTTQGGYLMKKVHISGGETKEIVITGQGVE